MKQMLVYLIVLAVVSIGSKQVFGAVSKAFITDYDKKVCNNELTCNLTLVPGLEASKLTFQGRDCMCDAECPQYNDCCRDSPYIKNTAANPKNYTCHPTHKVYVVVGCTRPATTDSEKSTQKKCYEALEPLHEADTFVITPVTTAKNITYANTYCALCNGDDLDKDGLWTLTSGCAQPMRRPGSDKLLLNFGPYNSKLKDILPNVTYNATANQFQATYQGKQLVCEFTVAMPDALASRTRRCVANLVTSCPNDAAGTKQCQSYIAVVTDQRTNKVYRNRECALCNGVPADKISGCPGSTRTGASTLFSGGAAAGSDACSNPAIAAKFC